MKAHNDWIVYNSPQTGRWKSQSNRYPWRYDGETDIMGSMKRNKLFWTSQNHTAGYCQSGYSRELYFVLFSYLVYIVYRVSLWQINIINLRFLRLKESLFSFIIFSNLIRLKLYGLLKILNDYIKWYDFRKILFYQCDESFSNTKFHQYPIWHSYTT